MPIATLTPAVLLAVLGAASADPMVHDDASVTGCDRCAAMKAAIVAPGPIALRNADRAADSDTDVLHYDLDIAIVPSTTTISGTNTITVKSLVPNLTDFDIDLANVFSIPSVTVGGVPVSWTRLTSSVVRITLDRAYAVDEEFDVAITYSGVPNGGGFGSLTWSSAGGQPWVYSLSEPYYAYTWWPSKDVIADKATGDLRFTVPSNLEVASNGTMISNVDNGDSTRTFHYQTNYPTAPYLFCFGLGNYNFFSDVYTYAGGSTPLEFALLVTSDSPGNRAAWLKCKDMLPVYEPMFGEYPWRDEKYGIYQFGFSGGMEHQTMTGQGTTNESVTAHELGHQWWGDMVTCDSWNHIWCNEGFATYVEALWEERKGGSPNATALKSAMAARKPSSLGNTVYVPTTTSVNRIFDSDSTYRKGGWVLHMLRHKVGDTAFFQALQDYRAAHLHQTVTTEDVQAAFENVSGLDLTTFFNQWIYQPGAPQLRHALRSLTVDGQIYAEIYLTQTQSASYPTYELDVDARVTTPGGGVDIVLPISTKSRHYLIPFALNPISESIDPDGWLLYTNVLTTTFVEGPPRITSTVPAPDAVVVTRAMTQIEVQFHKNVSISVSDVFVTGDNSGPMPVGLSYDSVAHRATITPINPLGPDTYTVTIADTTTETASGSSKSLDGEIVGGAFPSGDGLEGGDAVFAFSVAPPACPGDVTGDGITNSADFNVMAGNFGGSVPAWTSGDLDGNGVVDSSDFNILAGDFGCGS